MVEPHILTITEQPIDQNVIDGFMEQWKDMIQEASPIDFKPGQIIFYQGHTPVGVYVFSTGEIQLVDDLNDPQVVKPVGLNEPVGLDLLSQKMDYPYHAIAKTEVQGFFLTKNSLSKKNIK